jgi:hypothetical protein
MGARFGSPLVFAAVLLEVFAGSGAGCFFVVSTVSIACSVRPAETARKSSAVARRRNNIYCTPMGLITLSG